MAFQDQPSGEYLNGMLDTILLLTQRVRPGKDPEFDMAAHELMAMIMDLKTFDLMDRLGSAWGTYSQHLPQTIQTSR
jgi:hypothetical protein